MRKAKKAETSAKASAPDRDFEEFQAALEKQDKDTTGEGASADILAESSASRPLHSSDAETSDAGTSDAGTSDLRPQAGVRQTIDADNEEIPAWAEKTSAGAEKTLAGDEKTSAGDEKTLEGAGEPSEETEGIPERVERLMKLNPQYEEIWVTPTGFVHPKGAPKYLLKGAILYRNRFYDRQS